MLTLECNAGIRKKNTFYFVYKFSCNRQLSFELFVMSFILAGLFLFLYHSSSFLSSCLKFTRNFFASFISLLSFRCFILSFSPQLFTHLISCFISFDLFFLPWLPVFVILFRPILISYKFLKFCNDLLSVDKWIFSGNVSFLRVLLPTSSVSRYNSCYNLLGSYLGKYLKIIGTPT